MEAPERYVPDIRKCHKSLDINLIYFVLPQFHSKKAMSQPPCFDIEYWRSHSPFLSGKLQWSKIQNIYIVSLQIFQYQYNNIPLILISTASFGGHSECIYAYSCTVDCYLSSQVSTMVVSLLVRFFQICFGSNVVPVVYSWTFLKFRFFPVWSNHNTAALMSSAQLI